METIEFWHWLGAGVMFVALEILMPGTFFLWMGISAGILGILVLLVPTLSWELQLLLFAIFSVASVVLWRLRLRMHPTPSENENLNQRAKQYQGRTFILREPIVDGAGKIYVDDSRWHVTGPDLGAGTKVKVVSANGSTLIVEPQD